MRWAKFWSWLILGLAFLTFQPPLSRASEVQKVLRVLEKVQGPPEVQEKLREFRLSLEVAQLLLKDPEEWLKEKPFSINLSPTPPQKLRQLGEVLNEAASRVDLKACSEGKWDAFLKSLDAARQILQPVADFAKEYTIYILGNAHIDMAWLWRWMETVEVCRATFSRQLGFMDVYPDYTYAQSQAWAYRWMEERYPEVFQGIQRRVRDRRWEIVGGMLVEPDCNLIGGESWVRQILYAKRYFREKFGVDVQIGWNPDSFGYNWNMPQFYRKSGIWAFITQKISWNDTNEFPYHLFWWEAPDGSRVLAYFPFTGYTGTLEVRELIEGLKQSEANTGRKDVLLLFGYGDHGGGPTQQVLDKLALYRKATVFPKVEFTLASDYLAQITPEEREKLPVWRDELYLEYHRGTYTTQAAIKKNNRKKEILLTNAEKVASLAHVLGATYPQKRLTEAWWLYLFNQFHDILPGSGIHAIYRDALESYHRVGRWGKAILEQALDYLQRRIHTKKGPKGRPLLVFNTLSWPRSGIVEVPVKPSQKGWVVLDPRGQEIPSQLVSQEDGQKLLFVAERVPALGYRVYKIRERTPQKYATGLVATAYSLENAYFRVEIDPKSGHLSRLFDKRSQREVLAAPGNVLQLFGDLPDRWDAWNIGYTGEKWELNEARAVELLESGPVRAVIRVKKDFLGKAKTQYEPTRNFPSSFFAQAITLYHNLPWVECRMEADWWEEHTLLKVAFPVNVRSRWATFEIPYAVVRRPTTRNNSWEKARFEVPALRWADLSDGTYGVSLLNESKYGYDVKGNVLRLTLLRSPTSPDPMADRGKHHFAYALYPHKGDWKTGGTVQKGWEFNVPLIAKFVPPHKGKWPLESSLIQVRPESVILAAIKKAEDSEALICRFYESSGQDASVQVTFFRAPKVAQEVDLMEQEIGAISVKGRTISFPIKKHEIKSLKVEF